jgi:hypothetical protein
MAAGSSPPVSTPSRYGIWRPSAKSSAGRPTADFEVITDPADELRLLLVELEDAEFARRETARRRLAQLGELAETALKEALQKRPSLEMRRRIEKLLAEPRRVTEPEARRGLRAVRVMEHSGTPPARELLATMARGAADARVTQEAKAALERLKRRTPASGD